MRLFCSTFLAAACLMTTLLQQDLQEPQKKGRDYYEARDEIVWEVPTHEKIIALTFDDGPDPTDTPAILDLLKLYDAKATFFVVGKRVELYPELARREIREGHEIANHTYSHRYFNKRILEHKIREEIGKAEQTIVHATGQKPTLFRPPGGFYSQNVVNASLESGYKVVMWSWHQDTEDWNIPGVGKIVKKVLGNARNGDIILFHDYVEGKTQTVDALKEILPQLKERGYHFVTVSQLLTHQKSAQVGN